MRATFSATLLLALLFSFATEAGAQVTRVFVSQRTGDDSNSCDSITTPCLTFRAAAAQVDSGGEIIVLDSGDYGPVTLTKSVTIDAAAAGVVASIHPRGGDAVTINAASSDIVILRGLSLSGGPQRGIIVNSVGTLHVEHCTISGFRFNGLDFTPLRGNLFVKDTVIRGNDIGLNIRPTGGAVQASLDRLRIESNRNGVVVTDGVVGSLRDSVCNGNGGQGIFIATSNNGETEFNIVDTLVANNAFIGIQLTRFSPFGSATARIERTTCTGNRTGLYNRNGVLESFGNNSVRGNATDVDGEVLAVPTI